MGAAESTSILKSHQNLLDRFAGAVAIPLEDPFWDELLSFPIPLTKVKPSEVEAAIKPSCSPLVLNNLTTSHFPKLLIHLIRSLEEASSTSVQQLPLRTINAACFTRVCLKHYVEYYGSEEIANHMVLRPEATEGADGESRDMLVPFVRALLSFVGDVDVAINNFAYLLHLEVINLLLVSFATQLHATSPTSPHLFLDTAVAQKDLAGPCICNLLQFYIARAPLPPRVPYFIPAPPSTSEEERPGVLRTVAASAGTVLFLPYYAISYLVSTNAAAAGPGSPLADNSLLLLLVLVHYGARTPMGAEGEGEGGDANGAAPVDAIGENPFRLALQTCRDAEYDATDPGLSPHGRSGLIIRVPFAKLYDTMGTCLVDDRTTLLLYSLLHGNAAFLEYVLVRTDLDTLLMPILEMLYTASRRTPNQIYMLLIILLILSQDASFNANVHKLALPAVPWFKERLLPKITLGSLMVVILIRIVKYNLSKLRDVYLHTNCLATLANMAPHVYHLNAYASQRLVSLFDMLARKYTHLSDAQRNAAASLAHTQGHSKRTNGGGGVDGKSDTGSSSSPETSDEVPTELHIYTDFLRIVLEIINAILTYALPRNPEVIYALLHRQELFQPFRNHPRFYELLDNIYTVLDFFNVRMDDSRITPGEWSVERVLEIIVAHARGWRGDGMKMFTELRFTYEEELHPEEFFIPYIWTLVVAHSVVPWDSSCITLFSSQSGSDVRYEDVYDVDAYDGYSENTPTSRTSATV